MFLNWLIYQLISGSLYGIYPVCNDGYYASIKFAKFSSLKSVGAINTFVTVKSLKELSHRSSCCYRDEIADTRPTFDPDNLEFLNMAPKVRQFVYKDFLFC